MQVGIVGLPGSGKSALFSALTGNVGGESRGGGVATAPTVGIARVPDSRLETIAQFIATKQIVPATIRVLDIPGFAVGGESSAFARQILANIREVDAICHVVRCFRGLEGSNPSPRGDIDTMETEMIFADFAVAEPAKEKAARGARSGDKEIKQRLAALDKVVPVLDEGRPIRSIRSELTDEDLAALNGYGMLTVKPVLYVANIDEGDLGGESAAAKAVEEIAHELGGEFVSLCAKIESELVELENADRAEMLESLGIEEPAVNRVAQALYRLLGRTSFYTAGEKEIRAWTIPAGAAAPEAAGAIHSDIQRGFIRAECYHVDDLVQYKTEKAIREAGHLRSEGKNYIMKDGDVVHFLFNV